MAMLNPPHPCETIRELCLGPLGLTVTNAAKGLGITRKAVFRIVKRAFRHFNENSVAFVVGFWWQLCSALVFLCGVNGKTGEARSERVLQVLQSP